MRTSIVDFDHLSTPQVNSFSPKKWRGGNLNYKIIKSEWMNVTDPFQLAIWIPSYIFICNRPTRIPFHDIALCTGGTTSCSPPLFRLLVKSQLHNFQSFHIKSRWIDKFEPCIPG